MTQISFSFKDITFLEEFVTCADAFSPDKEAVYLCNTGGSLELSFSSYKGSVFCRQKIPVEHKFRFGVAAKNFCKSIKRALNSEVEITLNKSFMSLKEKNTKVKLPTQIYQKFSPPKDLVVLSADTTAFITKELPRVFSNIKDTKIPRFPGVLVDQTQNFMLLCNFSDTAISLAASPSNDYNNRYVISPDVAKLLKSKLTVANTFLGKNHFGVETENGVLSFSPLMSDTYPKEYLSSLGLQESISLIDKQQYFVHVFDTSHLLTVIDGISSILGTEEVAVNFSICGSAGGNPVWEIKSRNFDGFGVEEVITSLGEIKDFSFSVNRVSLKNFLSSYDEEKVYLYVREGNAVVLGNEASTKLVILLKAG